MVYLLGNLFLLNLFIAILFANFTRDDDEADPTLPYLENENEIDGGRKCATLLLPAATQSHAAASHRIA